MNYIPNTDADRKFMLQTIGVKDVLDLFKDIPQNLILKKDLDLPQGLTEIELKEKIIKIGQKNQKNASFLGAGSYNHYIPAVVKSLVSRSEFYTAYTPYQPEISQGTLQAIFEYQSMICDLTGMNVSNASMYDGATALAEAMILAVKATNKKTVLAAKTIHPNYRAVLKTYATANEINMIELDSENGVTDLSNLTENISDDTAAILIQTPNFFGCLEDLTAIRKLISNEIIFISCTTEALSWAILKPFADFGVDIVTGEAQSFGNAMNCGGPGLGVMAVKQKFVRQIPGRLIGQTVDAQNKRGFVLTLSTREQHIRREKATSNICSNQSLCALTAAIYLAILGKNLKKLAELNHQLALYLQTELSKIPGIELVFTQSFFNEFVVKVSPELCKKFTKMELGLDLQNYYPELKNCWLITCTELNSKAEIEKILADLQSKK